MESPVFPHSRETAAAISNCQCFGFVVPVQRINGIRSMFVIVIVAFVIVEPKVAVSSGADSQLNRISLGRSRSEAMGRLLQQKQKLYRREIAREGLWRGRRVPDSPFWKLYE